MNTTVDFETARQLREAGFPQPEPGFAQTWHGPETILIGGQFDNRSLRVFTNEGQGEFEPGFISSFYTYAPTALDIIAQMPGEAQYLIGKTSGTTLSILPTGEWVCRWPITAFQNDFRQDHCPHLAAAKAFIAWKKGKE